MISSAGTWGPWTEENGRRPPSDCQPVKRKYCHQGLVLFHHWPKQLHLVAIFSCWFMFLGSLWQCVFLNNYWWMIHSKASPYQASIDSPLLLLLAIFLSQLWRDAGRDPPALLMSGHRGAVQHLTSQWCPTTSCLRSCCRTTITYTNTATLEFCPGTTGCPTCWLRSSSMTLMWADPYCNPGTI